MADLWESSIEPLRKRLLSCVQDLLRLDNMLRRGRLKRSSPAELAVAIGILEASIQAIRLEAGIPTQLLTRLLEVNQAEVLRQLETTPALPIP